MKLVAILLVLIVSNLFSQDTSYLDYVDDDLYLSKTVNSTQFIVMPSFGDLQLISLNDTLLIENYESLMIGDSLYYMKELIDLFITQTKKDTL